jgi:ribonuclease D
MHSTFIFVTNRPRCEDWNIMGNQKMANVATLVPTTLDELADCELPQNVQKQYGERLIKNINAYIEQENLQHCVENRPKKKWKTD